MPILPVGNDIIDLALERSETHHPRFPQRVLSAGEFASYQQRGCCQKYLWQAWAAKEAAYKYFKQLDSSCVFSPAAFVFAEDQKTVKFSDRSVPLHIEATNEYLYCIALPLNKQFFSSISHTTNDSHESQSSLAKSMIKKLLIEHVLTKKSADLIIQSNMEKIPQIFIGGKHAHQYSVSISHHGTYVAAAIAINEPKLTVR